MQSDEAFVRLQSMFASSNEQSIRNQLPGVVKSIVSDKVMSEVIIETSLGEIYSVITTRSVGEMNLKLGDKVYALIKATSVSLRSRG